MSCSVAIGSSPVFSQQMIPLTFLPSPETLAVGLAHNQLSPAATTSLSRSVPLLKRKRPARIDIPMMGLQAIEPPLGSDGRREIEEDGARYSVYCKRGRKRIEMEDRYSAAVDLQGDSHMVIDCLLIINLGRKERFPERFRLIDWVFWVFAGVLWGF